MVSPEMYCNTFRATETNEALRYQIQKTLQDEKNDTCITGFDDENKFLQITVSVRGPRSSFDFLLLGSNLECYEPFVVSLVHSPWDETIPKRQCSLQIAPTEYLRNTDGCIFLCISNDSCTDEEIIFTVIFNAPKWKVVDYANTSLCEIIVSSGNDSKWKWKKNMYISYSPREAIFLVTEIRTHP